MGKRLERTSSDTLTSGFTKESTDWRSPFDLILTKLRRD
jgi:hypothetical protein